MNIEIQGLTPKQIALCDIMWAIESKEGVQRFISSLPMNDQRDCHSLIECMQWAFLDEVQSIDEAKDILQRFI